MKKKKKKKKEEEPILKFFNSYFFFIKLICPIEPKHKWNAFSIRLHFVNSSFERFF